MAASDSFLKVDFCTLVCMYNKFFRYVVKGCVTSMSNVALLLLFSIFTASSQGSKVKVPSSHTHCILQCAARVRKTEIFFHVFGYKADLFLLKMIDFSVGLIFSTL